MEFFRHPLVVDFISILLPLLLGWLVGSRQKKADATKSEIENTGQAIKIWREMTADLKAEMADLKEELEHTRNKNKQLEQELEDIKADLEEMLKSCPNNCPAPEVLKKRNRKTQ